MSGSPPKRLLERIRAEYPEMPRLRLTLEQMQRLGGVVRTLCKMVLDALRWANAISAYHHEGARKALRPVRGRPIQPERGEAHRT